MKYNQCHIKVLTEFARFENLNADTVDKDKNLSRQNLSFDFVETIRHRLKQGLDSGLWTLFFICSHAQKCEGKGVGGWG